DAARRRGARLLLPQARIFERRLAGQYLYDLGAVRAVAQGGVIVPNALQVGCHPALGHVALPGEALRERHDHDLAVGDDLIHAPPAHGEALVHGDSAVAGTVATCGRSYGQNWWAKRMPNAQ